MSCLHLSYWPAIINLQFPEEDGELAMELGRQLSHGTTPLGMNQEAKR